MLDPNKMMSSFILPSNEEPEIKFTISVNMFENFLKENGAFNDWQTSFVNENRNDNFLGYFKKREHCPETYIRGAFNWFEAPGGNKRWNLLNKQWQKYIRVGEDDEIKI